MGVGEVDIVIDVNRQFGRSRQRGRGYRDTVSSVIHTRHLSFIRIIEIIHIEPGGVGMIIRAASDRVDDAIAGVDFPNHTIAGIGNVDVPVAVDRHPAREAQKCRRRRSAISSIAIAPTTSNGGGGARAQVHRPDPMVQCVRNDQHPRPRIGISARVSKLQIAGIIESGSRA